MMRNFLQKVFRKAERAKLFFLSYFKCLIEPDIFNDIEVYCMFVGYPRSGHSLIGSLLDAHPNMIIAHELDALRYIGFGISKRHLYYLLLGNSQMFAKQGRIWTGYSYEVPNQWQGRFERLQVIGDKKGGASTLRLQRNQELLQRLQQLVGVKIKILHVIRNPYDNISTIMMRASKSKPNLETSIDYYFNLCFTISNLKKQIEGTNVEMLDIRVESFIENPREYLKQICQFLGVEATDDYLADCASIVFKSPKKSRYRVTWPQELIEVCKNRISDFAFLEGYSYED